MTTHPPPNREREECGTCKKERHSNLEETCNCFAYAPDERERIFCYCDAVKRPLPRDYQEGIKVKVTPPKDGTEGGECATCKDYHYLCGGKVPCLDGLPDHRAHYHDWQPCPDCNADNSQKWPSSHGHKPSDQRGGQEEESISDSLRTNPKTWRGRFDRNFMSRGLWACVGSPDGKKLVYEPIDQEVEDFIAAELKSNAEAEYRRGQDDQLAAERAVGGGQSPSDIVKAVVARFEGLVNTCGIPECGTKRDCSFCRRILKLCKDLKRNP